MDSNCSLLLSLFDGAVKILPALLAAFYAYKLWRQKVVQDRADAVVRGCLLLRNFCSMLSSSLLDDPEKPNPVSITAVNNSLDSILSTASVASHFADVMETFTLWQRKVYLHSASAPDIAKRQSILNACINDCNSVINTLREKTPAQLLSTHLSRL
jgi:hypothetical protein